MFKAIGEAGRLTTPVGTVRLGMSCGMASGSQAYYLVGSSRRALVVAGSVSTKMARLEAAADRGQALVCDELASNLPRGWVQRRVGDGAWRLRFNGVRCAEPVDPSSATDARRSRHLAAAAGGVPVAGRHRRPRWRAEAGGDGVHQARRHGRPAGRWWVGRQCAPTWLRSLTSSTGSPQAHGVCWLETQAEANSVRWTLIAGAPTATEHDGERLLRVVRAIADQSPAPLRIGANLGVVFVGDMGHPQRCTYIVMGDTTNLAARLMVHAQPGEIIAGERLHESCAGTFDVTALEPMTVKGKKQPVQAYVIERSRRGVTQPPPASTRATSSAAPTRRATCWPPSAPEVWSSWSARPASARHGFGTRRGR